MCICEHSSDDNMQLCETEGAEVGDGERSAQAEIIRLQSSPRLRPVYLRRHHLQINHRSTRCHSVYLSNRDNMLWTFITSHVNISYCYAYGTCVSLLCKCECVVREMGFKISDTDR